MRTSRDRRVLLSTVASIFAIIDLVQQPVNALGGPTSAPSSISQSDLILARSLCAHWKEDCEAPDSYKTQFTVSREYVDSIAPNARFNKSIYVDACFSGRLGIISVDETQWRIGEAKTPATEIHEISKFCWNGERYYDATTIAQVGNVNISRDPNGFASYLNNGYPAAPISGIFVGDLIPAYTIVLSQDSHINSITSDWNVLPGLVTTRLDISTGRGLYSLWFSPFHDGHLVKAHVHRAGSDLYYKSRTDTRVPPLPGNRKRPGGIPLPPVGVKTAVEFSFDNVALQRDSSGWYVQSADVVNTEAFENGRSVVQKWSIRSRSRASDDQNQLRSGFVPDLTENSTVYLLDENLTIPRVWRNGRPTPSVAANDLAAVQKVSGDFNQLKASIDADSSSNFWASYKFKFFVFGAILIAVVAYFLRRSIVYRRASRCA